VEYHEQFTRRQNEKHLQHTCHLPMVSRKNYSLIRSFALWMELLRILFLNEKLRDSKYQHYRLQQVINEI
jgi:hypothetical protein